MSDFYRELEQWLHEVENFHLPRWHELPDLNLYMDQVLTYINDTLGVIETEDDDRGSLLTAAMINNYVKHSLIPKPKKKRYQREHIACLFVYVLLKPVLSLSSIQDGLHLQVDVCKGNLQVAYDLFCRQFERSLHDVSRMVSGKGEYVTYGISQNSVGTYMAASALVNKIVAEKVIEIKRKTIEAEKTQAASAEDPS